FREAARQRVPYLLLERILVLGGRDDDAALGICCRNGKEGLAQTPVPIKVFFLEAVACRLQRALELALPHPAECLFRVHVENDREVGRMAVQREVFQRPDQLLVHAAGKALIGTRRVVESIRHDPLAGGQVWRDQLIDMIEPRRREEHRLAPRPPAFGAPLQNEGANGLGSWRAARLPGPYGAAGTVLEAR